MILDEKSSTYYDVLDVKPEATPEEIRDAYLRTKSAYSKDSVALYTLVSPEETRAMLAKIEEAYQVLSSPQRRREYDAHHGFLDPDDEYFQSLRRNALPPKKIISIDRVPPMDTGSSGDDLLVAPATDFGEKTDPNRPLAIPEPPSAPEDELFQSHIEPKHDPMPDRRSNPRPTPPPYPHPPAHVQKMPVAQNIHSAPSGGELEREIEAQTEWRGEFLRRVREAMKLSIEEMATSTKISKTYLLAIEDEEFVKLPAAVYVRGFVMQIAKTLKLPHDKVAPAYMERYKKVRS